MELQHARLIPSIISEIIRLIALILNYCRANHVFRFNSCSFLDRYLLCSANIDNYDRDRIIIRPLQNIYIYIYICVCVCAPLFISH